MLTKIATTLASLLLTTSALALDSGEVTKSIPLKDGSTVHVFPNGKMGMEDRFGNAAHMADGHVMEARSGEKITMKGNEVARIDAALHHDHRGN